MKGYQNPHKIYESTNSRVYRAFEEKNNRPVVLKVLNKQYPTPEEVAKFNREYEIASMCTGQGVIEQYELSKIDNSPAIIMEDIGGRSLADILKSMKLHLDEFLSLSVHITEIIGNIHKRNIIHKDINPSNIIWNIEQNIVKIIDFGIATELTREITSVKNPNVLEGTVAYISPEQTGRMNRSLDYRTDYYSLGVTFYWMLTGRLPFESKDLLELVHSHIAVEPVSPHEIDATIPETVSKIVMKLMAKNAEDRYLSAYGIKADLEQCRDTEPRSDFELGKHDVSDKFQIPQKLYGREQELETLMSAFERVRKGSTELMLVSGFSGIGKSVLVNEIQRPVVKHKGYFISGKFEKLKKDVPYSAIIPAFTGLARQILAEGDANIDRWKEKILSALGPNGIIVTDIIPLFELIIGKQANVPSLGPVESQNRFNRLFQRFIKVLAGKEHPLVLFLDDLQWADSGSLHLLELFTTDPDIKHLFIIGAYRHNEIPDEIIKSGGTVNTIFLQPLSVEHVNQLLGDTLNRPPEETKSLTKLLIKKTGGNQFFINEFLKSLYKESLIEFSSEEGWSWDIPGIEDMQATENVVGLMAIRIVDLSENAQEVLKRGACIGSYFSIEALARALGKPVEDTLPALHEILQEGMLYKTRNIYRFSHDRIQEAAYSLIPDEEKIERHYAIGNLVLHHSKRELSERIFYIVNQLNAGVSLVTEKSEKSKLAELNLMAGKKALASNAYESALNYLKAGIELLERNSWQKNYEFTHEVYQEATVAAELSADYETMEKLAEEVILHARTIPDTIKVYEAKIFACQAQNQLIEGIRIGLSVLKKLGLRLPEKPGTLRIAYELLLVKMSLLGKSVDNLINLPEMKDPHKLAIIKILSGIGTPAYYAAPELLPLTVFNIVRLSAKYGNSIYTPYSYAGYGMIHCGLFGDTSAGFEWGKLALNIVEKFSIIEAKPRVWFVIWYMVNHWKIPLRDSLKPLLEAYAAGLETGNLEFAALSRNAYSFNSFFSGMELAGVKKEIERNVDIIRKFNQDTVLNYQLIFHQAVLNLRGMSKNPCKLIGSSYDENKMLLVHKKTNDKTAIFCVYYFLLNLNYLFENHKEALKNAELVKPYSKQQISLHALTMYNFYDSLTRLALKKDLKHVAKNQEKMKKWAFHAPMNYSHKYHLVEAEIARVRGQKLKAMDHYKRAAALAHENKFTGEEALALELTAKFWLGLNEEKVAAVYITEARNTYGMWGAIAKVKHIEEKYQNVLSAGSKGTGLSLKTTTSSSDAIDLSTVIKTSQALSSETNLGRLLKEIMKLSIKNAGAQKGFLIIENEENKNLYIEAQGEPNKEISVLESIPVENTGTLSSAIVNYVNRTGENLVLNNAHKEGNFTEDPYIIKNKPKSLICFPIKHKGRVSGIMYLENNLTTNSFTNERLALLRILSSQASISIENARLLMHRENAAKLEKEMEIAANIQTALLPKKPAIQGYEISAYLTPADDVGGDYYDIINTGERDWIIIGDVSGHSVPAGLVMMMVQTCIHHTLSICPQLPPAELLTIVNKTITENIELMGEEKYMTINVFAVLENGKFIFAGLHHDILIYRAKKGDIELVESNGAWLGAFSSIQGPMKDNNFELDRGDTMLIYTDGITEAWIKGSVKHERDPAQDMFGENRLKDIFRLSGKRPVEEIKNKILKELEEYDCDDDVTMVVVRRVS
ncbi:MAG: AAA family ATPase [bacterium]|nr:AAA family ATPase [bacterium]